MTTGRHMDPGQMDPEFAKFREKRLSNKIDPARLEPNAKAPVEPPAREGRQLTPPPMPRPSAPARSSGVIEPNTHAAAGAHRGVATPGEAGGSPANSNMPMFGTAGFQQPKEEPDPRRMKLSDLNMDVVKPPNDHVPIGESIKLIDIALDQAPPVGRPPARPAPNTKTPPSLAARPGANAPARPGQPAARPPKGPPTKAPAGSAAPRPPQARPPQAGAPVGAPRPQAGLKAPPPAGPRPPAPTVTRTPSGRLVAPRPSDAAPPSRPVPAPKKTTTRRLKGPRR